MGNSQIHPTLSECQFLSSQVAVGANAFAHESGIHADGALKDRRNYELFDYEELGRGEPEIIGTGRMITTGEYSGIKGFRNVYEKLEIEFKDDKEAEKSSNWFAMQTSTPKSHLQTANCAL